MNAGAHRLYARSYHTLRSSVANADESAPREPNRTLEPVDSPAVSDESRAIRGGAVCPWIVRAVFVEYSRAPRRSHLAGLLHLAGGPASPPLPGNFVRWWMSGAAARNAGAIIRHTCRVLHELDLLQGREWALEGRLDWQPAASAAAPVGVDCRPHFVVRSRDDQPIVELLLELADELTRCFH